MIAKVILPSLLMLLLVACNKEKNAKIEATVVRNCSGTYLNIDGKNYNVCNNKVLKQYNDGDAVKVAYHTIAECSNIDAVCAMYFQNEGLIEVDAVVAK